MNETNRTNDVLVGLVCGAALGAGVALLLAPAKGADTRRKIGETARRLRNGVNDNLERVKNAIESRTSEVRDAIDNGPAISSRRPR